MASPISPFEDIKHHRVAAYTTDDDRLVEYWHVHDALVGSIVLDKRPLRAQRRAMVSPRPRLQEGRGRQIHRPAPAPADKKLRPLKKLATAKEKGKKPKIGYQSEESYNEEIANEAGYLLMDQRLIHIDEVPGPGVEACDLLDIPGRRFIHVKKSSRQSSVLSHFFKQGGNAAQMLKKYEPFRAALIARVKEFHGDQGREGLRSGPRRQMDG